MQEWKEKLRQLARDKGMKLSENPDGKEEGVKMKRHIKDILKGREAYAPYNFIPLNESFIEVDPFKENDMYHTSRFTGCIDCQVETLTPIYIRDTYTIDDIKAQKKAEEKKERYIVPDFFSPAGKIRLPGSSLRGMIRTLIEIVSWGKFGFFEDRGLYYRGLADVTNLRKEYQAEMTPFKIKAGYIKRKGIEYFIIPAKKEGGKQFSQINKREARELCGSQYEAFKYFPVRDGKYIVVSGNMPNKKRDWLVNPPDDTNNGKKIPILAVDIHQYNRDENRVKDANLLDKIEVYPNGVPCFYVEWADKEGRKRVSFGHTGMFRLAYKKSIGEHIPEFLQDDSKIDIAEAIFGKAAEKGKDSFAGRVFFEDAILYENQEDVLMKEGTPRILSTPKPTTFQHYLVQDSDDKNNLNHYNSDTVIRGNKLYWHKREGNWEETDKNKIKEHLSQYTSIKPVKPNIKFQFRIRFENLSNVELGALLFALKLPNGCAHKIGMGKPLGLGSIKITPALTISDREERYKFLFEDNGNSWRLPVRNEKSIDDFIKDFEKFILDKLGNDEKPVTNFLWDTYRLTQLKCMLDFEKGKKLEEEGKTIYMQIEGPNDNEFKDRKVLSIPEKV